MAEKKNRGGRPRVEIDKDAFETMCGQQCTEKEIAAHFRCSVDTIQNWCKKTYKASFSEVFKQKRLSGIGSLRSRAYEMAMAGDRTLMIFLLKNYAGMRDVPTDTSTSDKIDQIRGIMFSVPSAITGAKTDGGSDS